MESSKYNIVFMFFVLTSFWSIQVYGSECKAPTKTTATGTSMMDNANSCKCYADEIAAACVESALQTENRDATRALPIATGSKGAHKTGTGLESGAGASSVDKAAGAAHCKQLEDTCMNNCQQAQQANQQVLTDANLKLVTAPGIAQPEISNQSNANQIIQDAITNKCKGVTGVVKDQLGEASAVNEESSGMGQAIGAIAGIGALGGLAYMMMNKDKDGGGPPAADTAAATDKPKTNNKDKTAVVEEKDCTILGSESDGECKDYLEGQCDKANLNSTTDQTNLDKVCTAFVDDHCGVDGAGSKSEFCTTAIPDSKFCADDQRNSCPVCKARKDDCGVGDIYACLGVESPHTLYTEHCGAACTDDRLCIQAKMDLGESVDLMADHPDAEPANPHESSSAIRFLDSVAMVPDGDAPIDLGDGGSATNGLGSTNSNGAGSGTSSATGTGVTTGSSSSTGQANGSTTSGSGGNIRHSFSGGSSLGLGSLAAVPRGPAAASLAGVMPSDANSILQSHSAVYQDSCSEQDLQCGSITSGTASAAQ